MANKPPSTGITVTISRDLHSAVTAWASERGHTLKFAIEKALRKLVKP